MRIAFVLMVFMCYTLLFRKAAGTLNLKQLNMISCAYYITLFFCFIGASFIFCGFREHYLVKRLTQETIDKTYLILSYVLVVFPSAICIFNKLMGIQNMKKSFMSAAESDIRKIGHSNKVWVLLCFFSVISFCVTVYVFWTIGYFTLFEMFKSSPEILSKQRIDITNHFSGNIYIRNIVMLSLTPYLSYIAYLYMRSTHEKKWKILFACLFILSVIAKTYNMEKSPIVFYIFYFYLIEVLLGNIKNIKLLFSIALLGIVCILFYYCIVFGYSDKLLTLSSGPAGRIFITQISTLFLHIQAFPDIVPYLNGASLPTVLAKIFHLSESWRRSGRVVMEIYNPSAVAAGTAGVMNSLFVGEAYANWGVPGVILSPVYLGALYSAANVLLVKCVKTPLVLMVYIAAAIQFSQSLIGGFVDFLYASSLLALVGAVLAVELFCRRGKIVLKKQI